MLVDSLLIFVGVECTGAFGSTAKLGIACVAGIHRGGTYISGFIATVV